MCLLTLGLFVFEYFWLFEMKNWELPDLEKAVQPRR